MIDGVIVTPLKQIIDERGKIMHMLRCDADHFTKFGEVYFSTINQGVIKAWHIHREMTLNYAVPFGQIKFVLFDSREDSPTKGKIQEIHLGPDNYNLITVPPLVWNGFKGVSVEPAIVTNCTDIPHRPDEIERLSPFDKKIPYSWDVRHG